MSPFSIALKLKIIQCGYKYSITTGTHKNEKSSQNHK
uniref:Uncharacterized protein n=1 Tax=Rhizophora mucronata TaxID=61149 RepID=A0A2P2NA58_RHIMU